MESHQREKGLSMDWYGRQNDKVNELSKQYVKDCINSKQQHKPVQLWYEHFSLWGDGVKQSQICKKGCTKDYIEKLSTNIGRLITTFQFQALMT